MPIDPSFLPQFLLIVYVHTRLGWLTRILFFSLYLRTLACHEHLTRSVSNEINLAGGVEGGGRRETRSFRPVQSRPAFSSEQAASWIPNAWPRTMTRPSSTCPTRKFLENRFEESGKRYWFDLVCLFSRCSFVGFQTRLFAISRYEGKESGKYFRSLSRKFFERNLLRNVITIRFLCAPSFRPLSINNVVSFGLINIDGRGRNVFSKLWN